MKDELRIEILRIEKSPLPSWLTVSAGKGSFDEKLNEL